MVCKNCGKEVSDNFCSHCGQQTNVGRITFSGFVQEVSDSVFQINKGVFFTLKELFLRPGDTIREFLDGKRKNHFKPIGFVLTLSTLYFLITQLTDQKTYLDDFIDGYKNGLVDGESELEVLKILTWFSKNYAYSALILLPFFSLASFISFFKERKNYLEHIVLNSYITGLQALFYSFFALSEIFIHNEVIELFPFLFSAGYNFWVFWQFFQSGPRILNLLQSALTYLLFLLFNLIFFIIVSGVVLM